MKNKYYINPDTDELIIVTETGDSEFSVVELQKIEEIEYEDEDDEEEDVPVKPKREYKKREEEEETTGVTFRAKPQEKKLVLKLIEDGMNSMEIARELGWDITKANVIIDRLRGSDMSSKVIPKEGVGL